MSLNLLLRSPSVYQNVAADTMRRRMARTFRKTLGVYNYKVRPAEYYKNPHAMTLVKREQFRQDGSEKAMRKMRSIESMSTKPYGKFTTTGHFIRDTRMIPNFNIPDLTEFPLKPYVSYGTEKLEDDAYTTYAGMNRDLLVSTIKDQLKASSDPEVQKLYAEIFETEEGQKIVEEYLDKLNKKHRLRITNF
jgi:large subunit ribosomal protein L41